MFPSNLNNVFKLLSDNIGNTKIIHYLSGGAILINANGVETLYYGYNDYQGSLIALANETGTVVERYAYDPWGKRRNPANWTEDDSRTSWTINRGYTMHEHLDAFNIINMNGRVYDPLTAMFFSPDPFVQAPGSWLNYNRYGYAFWNPFRYTDPNGEKFIDFLIDVGVFLLDCVVVFVSFVVLPTVGFHLAGSYGALGGVVIGVGVFALYTEWKITWYRTADRTTE